MANHKYLTEKERVKLEYMLRKNASKKEIAAELNCCLATVYNEIKRGEYEHTLNSITGKIEKRYSEYKAQRRHNENLASKGAGIKIAKDLALAEFIERKMVDEKFSAEAVLLYIKTHPDECKFSVEIKSVNTIYSYIDRGFFERLTRFHLPQRFRKHKSKKSVVRVNTKQKKKRTIEERPREIESRSTIGDWEMDTVKSSKKIKASALVLTERKTRMEIIEPLKQGTIKEVVKALNKIERTVGIEFTRLFRTVTTDNGSEFKNAKMLEKVMEEAGFKGYAGEWWHYSDEKEYPVV